MTHDSRVDDRPPTASGLRVLPQQRAMLDEARYSIPAVCETCMHSVFVRIGPWGRCNLHRDKAAMTILRFGSCPSHHESETKTSRLQGYEEYLEPAF